MKAFRFPLQAVLTLREETEQEAQRTVARTLHAVALVQTRLSRVDGEIVTLETDRRARLCRGLPGEELAQLQNYQLVLGERRESIRRELAAAEGEVRKARQALILATQARQALETYRDRLHREYLQHQNRVEQKMLDDLAGRNTGGRLNESSAPAAHAP